MEITKLNKKKYFIVLLSIYGCYTFFIETDIYSISYPNVDDWNIEFLYQYHPKCTKKFLISNPPKEKFEVWEFLIKKLPILMNQHYGSSICSFEFYEEKWYLNRFFTTLFLDDKTIPEAIRYKYGEKYYENLGLIRQEILFKDSSPYFYFDGTKKEGYLLYFPLGFPNNSKAHWFLEFEEKNSFEEDKKKLIPVSLEYLSQNKEQFQNINIPYELLDPKNKDKWHSIYRH